MLVELDMRVALIEGRVKVGEVRIYLDKEFDSYAEQEQYVFDGYYEDVEQALNDYNEDYGLIGYDDFDVISIKGGLDEDEYEPDDDGMNERDFL